MMRYPTVCLVLLGLFCGRIQAQPFRNLGFDEADTTASGVSIGSDGTGFGSTADLLPGWKLYLDGEFMESIGINFLSISAAPFATLLDVNGGAAGPPEGRFGLLLAQTRFGAAPYSIVQRGEIPPGTTLLKLRYDEYPFTVSLNDTMVPSTTPAGWVRSMPEEIFYDVSQFAGQIVELRITTDSSLPLPPGDFHYIDSIAFIPEPETAVLLSLGGCVLIFVLLRKRGFLKFLSGSCVAETSGCG